LGAGLTGVFTVNANSLGFSVPAIPEPFAYAATFGALALAGAVCRRRLFPAS